MTIEISFGCSNEPARTSFWGLVLARQWIVWAPVEPVEVFARKALVADDKAGAMKADGCRFFEGEADGLGDGAEAPCTLGGCSLPVAAKVELGASVEV
jgi:hypothetical protein